MFAADLLDPPADRLTIYALGPGFGESQVVVLPDRRVVVVDACTYDGTNLPAALLRRLGVRSIDLLVLTHPDLDHVRGVAELVRSFAPGRIWRYPFESYIRDIVAEWCRREPDNTHHQELSEALAAIEDHGRRSGCIETAAYRSKEWQPPGGSYAIHALAPTHYDQERTRLAWSKLIERHDGRWRLSSRFQKLLDGTIKLGDVPNVISVAVVIEWGSRRVLLAGDVLNGNASRHSGWKGVLRALDAVDAPRGHLVNDLDLVKVSHHGSFGACSPEAWSRHAKSGKTTGFIAPFGAHRLPHHDSLLTLRAHCLRLGITTDAGGAFERAERAGWMTVGDAPPPSSSGPCLMAIIDAAGGIELRRGRAARIFQ